MRLLLGGAALACSPRANAEDEFEPIRIVYQSVEGCPSESAFVDELRSRTTRANVVTSGERRVFAVSLTVARNKVRGTLVIEAGERSSRRNVEGRTCAEVTSALALITALAVDPHASTKPAEELAPPPKPEPKPEPEPEPPREPTSPPAIDFVPTEPPPIRVEPDARRWSLSVDAGGELRSGAAPRIAPAFGGGIALARDMRALVSPSVRLSASAAPNQTQDTGGSSARFGLAVGRVEACPLRISLAARVAAVPCALGEAGVFSASGENLARVQTTSRSWFGTGASLRTTWQVSHLAFVSGVLSGIVPLRRDRFYAAPGTTLFEVPPVGFAVGLTLGLVLFS